MKPRRQRASSNANIAQPNNHNRTKSGSVPPAKPPQSVVQPQPSTIGMTPAMRYAQNLKALRRHDPSIFSIFDQFSHVCLYHYDGSKWVKKGFEGSFFLFERHAYPPYGFFILNRMGMDDYVQYIYPEDDLNVQGAFLMYKYYPEFSAHRLALAHAPPADSSHDPDSPDSPNGPLDRFTDAHGRVPSQLDVLTNWKYLLDKGDEKGHPDVLGLWMHSAGGRDVKDVMQRLHSYIQRGVPYPEQYRLGPDRPPTANPHANGATPSAPDGDIPGHQRSLSKASATSVAHPSRGTPLSTGHATNGGGGSEVDKLFSKFLPGSASTPAPRSSTTTSSEGKVTLETLFASASASGTPGPSATLGPAIASSAPSSSAAKGVALLDSIFASAGTTPPATDSYTSSMRPMASTPIFQDSPSAPPSIRPSFAQAQKYTPYSSPPTQSQYEIHSPKPAVAALPQILTQDVISSLLGLPSQQSPASRTPSAAPSSASSRSQRRYEGDVDTSDNDATSDRSPALYNQKHYLRSELEQSLPSVAAPAGAGGPKPGHIHGDVTPRPPFRGFGSGDESSLLAPSTVATKKPDFPTSSSESTITPESWTSMVAESMAMKKQGKAKEQVQAQEKGRQTPGRTLVPFHEESTLWPYPRAPLDDRDTSDDAEVVELDFADTSALSDMDAFARRQKSKGKVNGRKSRKGRERDNQAERAAIEKSWDAPSPVQPTPPPQVPVRPASVAKTPATVVKPATFVSKPPPSTTAAAKAAAPLVNGTAGTPVNGHEPSVGTRIDVNSLFRGASQETSPTEEGPISRSAVSSAIVSQVEARKNGQAPVLEKNAFVREVLTLIHTDKRFVDQLYENYLTTKR